MLSIKIYNSVVV